MKFSPNESIFCQALAITSLLGELSNNNFLQSEYYKNLRFSGNNDNFKKIIDNSGLGNPATMQMFLYVLLVMPKEILERNDDTYRKRCKNEINQLTSRLIAKVNTTYKNESNSDISTIDFYAHTRNAVAHSRCTYETVNDMCYVTFRDEQPKNPNIYCEFTIKTSDVGSIIEKLQIQMMQFLNTQWSKR